MTTDQATIIYYAKQIDINFRDITDKHIVFMGYKSDKMNNYKIKKINLASIKSFFEPALALPILKLEINSKLFIEQNNKNNKKLPENLIYVKESAHTLFNNNLFDKALEEYATVYNYSKTDYTAIIPIAFIYAFCKNNINEAIGYLETAVQLTEINNVHFLTNFINFFNNSSYKVK